jgi:hypothetical protein
MMKCKCGLVVIEGVNGQVSPPPPWAPEEEPTAECYGCENAAMEAGEKAQMEAAARAEERYRGEG